MKLAYSVTSSIVFFIVATIAFVAIKFSMRPKKAPVVGEDPAADGSWIATAAYVFITLLAQIIANFSNAKAICKGSTQSFGLVLLYTLIPYFLILGTVMVLVTVLPGWLTPFSNTIGYACASIMGLSTTFNNLLATDPQGNDLLTKICSDKALLINEMGRNNYADFMAEMAGRDPSNPKEKGPAPGQKSMLKANYLEIGETKKGAGDGYYNKLYGLVLLKGIVAEGLWYGLAGCLAISIANNVIVNIQCNYSAKQMAKMHGEVKAQQAKEHVDSLKNAPVLYTKHT